MRRVKDDILIVIVGLLLVLGPSSTAPKVALGARDSTQFMLSDGDTVTCIPIENQASLINETSPIWNRAPTTQILPGNSTLTSIGVEPATQTLALEKGACPDGTIPVRKTRSIGASSPFDKFGTVPHEYGIAMLEQQLPTNVTSYYKGTEVTINVWHPYVESLYEFSLAQLWLATDYGNLSILNTIEVGYQVSTGHFGDSLPRLFVFWTANDYNGTGCYNLDCPGFVQVSNKVLIGGSFTPQSSELGQQYEIKLRVFKDEMTGDWWLQVNDETVGYWPKHIFVGLQGLAEVIQWGGEIVDDQYNDTDGLHTHTQMGSGEFANEGFGRAAYMRNLQYIDENDSLVDAPIQLFNTNASCYSVDRGSNFSEWGSYFFYGGKGFSDMCRTNPVFQSP